MRKQGCCSSIMWLMDIMAERHPLDVLGSRDCFLLYYQTDMNQLLNLLQEQEDWVGRKCKGIKKNKKMLLRIIHIS